MTTREEILKYRNSVHRGSYGDGEFGGFLSPLHHHVDCTPLKNAGCREETRWIIQLSDGYWGIDGIVLCVNIAIVIVLAGSVLMARRLAHTSPSRQKRWVLAQRFCTAALFGFILLIAVTTWIRHAT